MLLARALSAVAVVVASPEASADPSERTDRGRVYQAIPIVAGGALYLALEFGLKDKIVPQECRWCESNAFDTAVRSALRWDDVRLAASLSNWTGYVGSPVLAVGLLGATTAGDDDWRRTYDDVTPVLQAGIMTGMVNWISKAIAGRRRPYATFGAESVRSQGDVNTSFFSGHTALAFSMATSSGTVASLRGYGAAPVLWIGGLTLAAVTGYLRIAADAHYATDVLTGAVVGGAIGVAMPLLFSRSVLTDEPAVPRHAADQRPVIFSVGSTF